MSAYDLIREAVVHRRSISCTYKGHLREMSPHVIGVKDGRRQALFYQFGGSSSSGLAPAGSPENWRCIPVDVLTDVAVIDRDWHSAPSYSRSQTCVDDVDVKVDF